MALYVILGNPVPLARPRMGNGRVWNIQSMERFKWRLELESQNSSKFLYTTSIHMDIKFYMGLPEKVSKKRKEEIKNAPFHKFKPDLDNLLKFILDAATGILYTDDCIISSINCSKVYDASPRTEFTIREL